MVSCCVAGRSRPRIFMFIMMGYPAARPPNLKNRHEGNDLGLGSRGPLPIGSKPWRVWDLWVGQ